VREQQQKKLEIQYNVFETVCREVVQLCVRKREEKRFLVVRGGGNEEGRLGDGIRHH
jgi:hypothetical protein